MATWLRTTTTDQGWGMFAPNPPRSNVFMKVLVTDADGRVWDLETDVYAEAQAVTVKKLEADSWPYWFTLASRSSTSARG